MKKKQGVLLKNLQELLKYIILSSLYFEIASSISMRKAELMKNAEKLTDPNEQGEVWRREINTIIRNLKSHLD